MRRIVQTRVFHDMHEANAFLAMLHITDVHSVQPAPYTTNGDFDNGRLVSGILVVYYADVQPEPAVLAMPEPTLEQQLERER